MKPPFLLLFVLVLPSAISADQDSEPWAVGDCILAQFSMNITIYLGKNESGIVIQVPSDAQVQTDGAKSSCGAAPNATDQSMTLGWNDKQANDSIPLYREITIKFKKDEANGYYGVERFHGSFTMGKWNVSNVINGTATNTIYNSTVTVDKEVKKLLFHTPLTQSYTCKEWGEANNLTATIKYLPEPHLPVNLPNPLVHTSMLKFDAFRTEKHADKPQFRAPLDCDYPPNDIVPIAVGVALAILVIVVLVAYVVGRRRNRQHGYESV